MADENRVKKIRLPAPRGLILDRNGVDLATLAAAAAHVVGYLGKWGEEEVGLLKKEGAKYESGSLIGRGGIELVYEEKLRGVDGGRLVEVDPHQNVVRELGRMEPIPGQELKLTIDADLQKVAYDGLAGRRGAVVVSDSKTGEVLALVSSPSFDPRQVRADSPFFNRAVGGISARVSV